MCKNLQVPSSYIKTIFILSLFVAFIWQLVNKFDVMDLNEKFKLKAQVEVREDDLRKQQALEQFREWLCKQGHIKNCRTGKLLVINHRREHFFSF